MKALSCSLLVIAALLCVSNGMKLVSTLPFSQLNPEALKALLAKLHNALSGLKLFFQIFSDKRIDIRRKRPSPRCEFIDNLQVHLWIHHGNASHFTIPRSLRLAI